MPQPPDGHNALTRLYSVVSHFVSLTWVEPRSVFRLGPKKNCGGHGKGAAVRRSKLLLKSALRLHTNDDDGCSSRRIARCAASRPSHALHTFLPSGRWPRALPFEPLLMLGAPLRMPMGV